MPEGPAGQVCWVETCATCHAYWKARAVLRPAPPEVLLIDDARSLELDVIAADRGFARPARHGFQVRVRVAPLATAGSRHG